MSKNTVSSDIVKQLENLADRTANTHDRELLKNAADLVQAQALFIDDLREMLNKKL